MLPDYTGWDGFYGSDTWSMIKRGWFCYGKIGSRTGGKCSMHATFLQSNGTDAFVQPKWERLSLPTLLLQLRLLQDFSDSDCRFQNDPTSPTPISEQLYWLQLLKFLQLRLRLKLKLLRICRLWLRLQVLKKSPVEKLSSDQNFSTAPTCSVTLKSLSSASS